MKSSMLTIDKAHMKQVCQPGSENSCAYLVMGSEGFECAKLSTLKYTIELRLAEGTMRATEDNCPGYNEEQE